MAQTEKVPWNWAWRGTGFFPPLVMMKNSGACESWTHHKLARLGQEHGDAQTVFLVADGRLPLLSSLSVPLFFRPLVDYACMDQAYNKQFLYLHQGKQLMEKVAGVAFFFETTGVGLGVLSAGAGTC
jgi:hypothetical protein